LIIVEGEQRVTVLSTIGRTRLIPLQHIVPEGSARILLKLEYENPTGSMKDRMALAMVEAAEADGRLRPGGSVVEYTGGSTGVSLAFVRRRSAPSQIVTSEHPARRNGTTCGVGCSSPLVPARPAGDEP
jgi:cysteine synthase A